jgi:hypothetical protein
MRWTQRQQLLFFNKFGLLARREENCRKQREGHNFFGYRLRVGGLVEGE